MSSDAAYRVIVNADDLGISSAVNEAIFAAMDAGFVTSATVIANGDAVDDAVRGAARFPRCSFGVHLNITHGRPFTTSPALQPLLDASGRLTRRIFSGRPGRSMTKAIAVEWEAQVKSLRGRGLRISHLDSHEHVHTIPALFTAFKSVQRQSGIRRARLAKNLYCSELPPASRTLLLKKAVWNVALRRYYRTRTTRWFTDAYSLLRVARTAMPANGTIEAMVHPGATDDAMMVSEMDALWHGALDDLPIRVSMITYHDV